MLLCGIIPQATPISLYWSSCPKKGEYSTCCPHRSFTLICSNAWTLIEYTRYVFSFGWHVNWYPSWWKNERCQPFAFSTDHGRATMSKCGRHQLCDAMTPARIGGGNTVRSHNFAPWDRLTSKLNARSCVQSLSLRAPRALHGNALPTLETVTQTPSAYCMNNCCQGRVAETPRGRDEVWSIYWTSI